MTAISCPGNQAADDWHSCPLAMPRKQPMNKISCPLVDSKSAAGEMTTIQKFHPEDETAKNVVAHDAPKYENKIYERISSNARSAPEGWRSRCEQPRSPASWRDRG